jgi:molecular chaperone DnaJ
MKRDFYEVLGVSRDADGETIRVAHRKLAMQFHPDRNPGDKDAEMRFKEVTEAYECLRDPDKKARYDRYGHAGLEDNGMGGPGGPMGDIFDILRNFMGGGGPRGPRRGSDLNFELTLSLVEAYQGCRKKLTLPRVTRCGTCSGSGMTVKSQRNVCRRCGGQGNLGFFGGACPQCRGRGSTISDPCPSCRGVGFVEAQSEISLDIPAGIDEGMILQHQGAGHEGDPGAPAGDLQCVIRLRPHNIFQRDGADLHCEVPISFSLAALGGPLEVPTLEGKHITATVPRGTQSGDQLRLSGHGMPHVRGGRRGSLIVHLKVSTPKNLTKRQEELFRELAELDGTNPTPESKTWTDRVYEFFASMGITGEQNHPGDQRK